MNFSLYFRRLFHLYTFFFLFYNSLSGLVTTVRRILTCFVVALFYLPRLDQPLVIGGLEFLDKGHLHYAVTVCIIWLCLCTSCRLHVIFGLHTSGGCLHKPSAECVHSSADRADRSWTANKDHARIL